MRKQTEGSRRGVGTRNEKSSRLAPGGGPRCVWRAGAGNWAHLLHWERSGLREVEQGDLASPWGGAWSSPRGRGDSSSASWASSELLRKGGTLGLTQGSHEFSTVAAHGRRLSPFSRRGIKGEAGGAAAVRVGLSQHSAYRVRAWCSALPLSLDDGLLGARQVREAGAGACPQCSEPQRGQAAG